MPASASTAQRSARKPGRNLPAEHSGRIVYADPRSLPSYPTVGVRLDCTNLAAIQASQTKSPPAIYTSGPVSSASLKAATAAAAAGAALHLPTRPAQASQTASVTESSEPPMSSRPAQRRNHQRKASGSSNFSPVPSASSMSAKAPVDTSTWGNSAATQAFRNSQVSQAARVSAPSPKPIPEVAALGPQPSLRAAVGAMRTAPSPSPSLRPRHMSNSTLSLRHQKSLSSHYPEGVSAGQASSSAANALKAATAATKARSGDRGSLYLEAGSVPYTTMGRQMYTSHPHIGPEHDNEAHEKMLHESAVAMAKKMYNPQAASQADSQAGSTAGVAGPGGTQGTNLQEAAYKLAQARLEALHEKYGKDREFRDYYVDPKMGSASASSAGFSRRFSMRDRLRHRRSSSDGEMTEERSIEIRNQMNQVSGKISAAETKKREDRQNVLLAAQRNVKSQLHDIDEKVYSNSGRVPPGTLASWEIKAHSVAQDRANAQLSMYPRADQVDIGGGTFVPRTQVDKIAARNVQPVIDDMHEKAQAAHERQEVVRKEQDDRKTEAALLKARDKELKDLKKKLKQEEKDKKKAAKAEEKARKAAKKRGSFMAANSPDSKDTKAASKPVAAIIPEAPTHQSARDEDELEGTDSEVMTAPDTTSSVRETRDVETPTPTTEPEHTALAAESVSKTREPVSPVSPGSPLSPVSPETRTGLVAPAAIVTAAGAIPAVIVGKNSTASPSSETSAPISAPEPASTSQAAPSSAAAAARAPSSSQLDPSAAPFVVPASTAQSPPTAALPESPSTPFTEPREAPAVPSTPPAATTSGFASNAPTSHLYSAFPSPPSPSSVSTPKTAAVPYSPTSESSTAKTGIAGTAGGAQETRSGRRLSSLFVKTTSRDSAPPKPIEYSEVDYEHRKNATQGTAVGSIGAVGAFGATNAVGSGFVSRAMTKSTSSSPTNNAASSGPGTSATDKSPPISATSGNESSSPRRNSKVKTWFSKFSKSGSKSGATDSGSKARDTTYSAAGTDINAGKTFVGGHALTSAENVSASSSGVNRAANNGTTDGTKNGKSPAMGSGGLNLSAIGGSGFAASNATSKAPETDKSVASSPPGLPDTGVPMDKKDGLNPGLLDITGKSRTGVVSESDADDKCAHVPLGTTVESVSSSSPTTRDFPRVQAQDAPKQPESPTSEDNMNGAGPYLSSGVSGANSAATGMTTAATGAVATKKDSAPGANEPAVPSSSNPDSNAPGDRASYVSYGSSNYVDDGAAATSGARGATGSGFGWAAMAKTRTRANSQGSNTFVTVPPPVTAPSTGTTGTASGESGIDTAYTLPKKLRDPANKKSASPVRDSRFLENLEDQF